MLQISFNLRGEIRDWLIETVVAYYAAVGSGGGGGADAGLVLFNETL